MTLGSVRRRAGALALSLVLTASAPVLAHAAPAASHAGTWHTIARQMLHAPVHSAATTADLRAGLMRPLLKVAAPAQAVTDPTKVGFTPPSNAIQPQAGAVDTTFANDNTKNVFAALNGGKYDAAGMTSLRASPETLL